jgi:NAD+ kinase
MPSAILITHTHPENSSVAVATAVAAAEQGGVDLYAFGDEFEKHGRAAAGMRPAEDLGADPDVCVVLGGDGSILYGLRRYANTGVPVFGINFGTIGFLAAVEREQLDEGLRLAFSGEFETLTLPALEAEVPDGARIALNDVSFARRPHGRVAELSYRVGEEEVGHVRCDGLVAATPQGSTGYNLANAGPILAWGVEGYVVSFIAPHTLTARALVVAPGDPLTVQNAAGRDPVDVHIDGEHCCELAAGDEIRVRYADGAGTLAQLPGASFYVRLREKFGRLAQWPPAS